MEKKPVINEENFTYFKSHEIFEELFNRQTEDFATVMGCSAPNLRKYQQPSGDDQSGRPNPIDRLLSVVVAGRSINPDKADLPLFYLCAKLGYFRPHKIPSVNKDIDQSKLDALSNLVKELGETMQAASELLSSNIDDQAKGEKMKTFMRELHEDFQKGKELLSLFEG
ncbi:MAG: hypothetical protein KAS32_22440 [Candidatus Peribacteraceae bacterium]|nr:hypothetical protein [Candidatus Peribacteraceae bacterium]